MDDLGNISIPGVKGVARLCRLVTLYERPLWDTNYSQFTVRPRSRVFLLLARMPQDFSHGESKDDWELLQEIREIFHSGKENTN
jgi:hypothetical protein